MVEQYRTLPGLRHPVAALQLLNIEPVMPIRSMLLLPIFALLFSPSTHLVHHFLREYANLWINQLLLLAVWTSA